MRMAAAAMHHRRDYRRLGIIALRQWRCPAPSCVRWGGPGGKVAPREALRRRVYFQTWDEACRRRISFPSAVVYRRPASARGIARMMSRDALPCSAPFHLRHIPHRAWGGFPGPGQTITATPSITSPPELPRCLTKLLPLERRRSRPPSMLSGSKRRRTHIADSRSSLLRKHKSVRPISSHERPS